MFYPGRDKLLGVEKRLFESRVIREKLEAELNELGSEGWEMVGFGMNDGAHAAVIIFKRAIE